MTIGQQLREARLKMNLTQEEVAERIFVSRQTISNWETGKSYPDIVSVIELSNLYHISLDMLLKGDTTMVKHLEKSTNLVASDKKIVVTLGLYLVVCLTLIFISIALNHPKLIGVSLTLMIMGITFLLYHIIKRI
ncbi:helix-turn-helix domain-containing protein [Streptococcus merionis]|uniref:helix-turn-helix domain-containing protein n=1 Tax=Streptococcus merionis TaxID=400065 RepID=UPI0026F08A44|nr:helix-turn-helix transcriptional regulator [Streptococcus merionis]